ncbi:ATP-binding cassette domain-containing protein [soil metagenome]
MTAAVLEIDGLSLSVPDPKDGDLTLIRDISLTIPQGTSVGLVGESGSGKSLTARAVIGLTPPHARLGGDIRVHGVSLDTLTAAERRKRRGAEMAMVFQNPRAHINPVRRVGDHLTEGLRLFQGLGGAEAGSRATELLRSVNFDQPETIMRRYPHQLSGGMLQRVMIAGALSCEPSLLLADEPTTALDTTTQAEVMGILKRLQDERGMAILFITHDLELAAASCDRTVVMYGGSIMEEQASEQLQVHPRHPYSAALLHARPSLSGDRGRLPTIGGRPVTAAEVTVGCVFATRCEYAESQCTRDYVPTRSDHSGRVACLRADELTLTGRVVSR